MARGDRSRLPSAPQDRSHNPEVALERPRGHVRQPRKPGSRYRFAGSARDRSEATGILPEEKQSPTDSSGPKVTAAVSKQCQDVHMAMRGSHVSWGNAVVLQYNEFRCLDFRRWPGESPKKRPRMYLARPEDAATVPKKLQGAHVTTLSSHVSWGRAVVLPGCAA